MRAIVLTSMLALAGLPAAPAAAAEPARIELTQAAAADAPAPTRYRLLQINAPKNAETIHDNTGTVQVEVALQPPLNVKAGHRLRVVLDNTMHSDAHATMRFTLTQVDRGLHSLQVIVVDEAGEELARSATTEFNMWRASRLFRRRGP